MAVPCLRHRHANTCAIQTMNFLPISSPVIQPFNCPYECQLSPSQYAGLFHRQQDCQECLHRNLAIGSNDGLCPCVRQAIATENAIDTMADLALDTLGCDSPTCPYADLSYSLRYGISGGNGMFPSKGVTQGHELPPRFGLNSNVGLGFGSIHNPNVL